MPKTTAINGVGAENVVETFGITAGNGSTTLTVGISGVDDITIVSVNPNPGVSLTINDTSSVSSVIKLTGRLSSTDVDTAQANISYGIEGITRLTEAISIDGQTYDYQKLGQYGTLYVNATSGLYLYQTRPDRIDALRAGEQTSDSFRVIGGSGSAALTVNINGADDSTVIPSVSIQLVDTNRWDPSEIRWGYIGATDVDDSMIGYGITNGTQLTGADVRSIVIDGVSKNFDVKKIGSFGTLFIQSSTGLYVYQTDSTKVNQLTTTNGIDTFTIEAGPAGQKTSRPLTVNIAAANDLPLITVGLPGAQTFFEVSGDDNSTSAINLGNAFAVSFSDTDGTTLDALSIKLNDWVSTEDQLQINTTSGQRVVSLISGADQTIRVSGVDYRYSYSELSGVRTITFTSLNGSGQPAATEILNFQNLLKSIAYNNISNNPDVHDRTFTLNVHSGSLVSAESTLTVKVVESNDPTTGRLTLSGSALIGGTLTADISGISDLDGALSWTYQWQSKAIGSNDWVNISGAVSGTYTVRADQIDRALRVVAFASDPMANHQPPTQFVSDGNRVAGHNITPTIEGSTPVALKEAGGSANATAGVASSSIALTLRDPEDGTPSYDTAWLTSVGGWSLVPGASQLYFKAGIYGKATLDLANHELSYALDDADVDTQALNANSQVTEKFTVRVKDSNSPAATAEKEFTFTITGANDAPALGVTSIDLTDANEDTFKQISVSDLINRLQVIDETSDSSLQIKVTLVSSGARLEVQNDNGIWRAVSTNDLLSASQLIRWQAPLNASGLLDAFKVKVFDGNLDSPEAMVRIDVTDVPDAPTGSVTVHPNVEYSGSAVRLFTDANFNVIDPNQAFKELKIKVSGLVSVDGKEHFIIDSGTGQFTIELKSSAYQSLGTWGGGYSVAMDGTTATVTFRNDNTGWTNTQLNDLVNGLQYQFAGGFSGSRQVTLESIHDSGASNNATNLSLTSTVIDPITHLVNWSNRIKAFVTGGSSGKFIVVDQQVKLLHTFHADSTGASGIFNNNADHTLTIDAFLVAGGGGGGFAGAYTAAGGGGAGEVVELSQYALAATKSLEISVGSGGRGGTWNNTNRTVVDATSGGASKLSILNSGASSTLLVEALGGGAGASTRGDNTIQNAGSVGGSGGGGSASVYAIKSPTTSVAAMAAGGASQAGVQEADLPGVTRHGHQGGDSVLDLSGSPDGTSSNFLIVAGGGGGAGTAGQDGSWTVGSKQIGAGGDGIESNFNGSADIYGAGGGGGFRSTTTYGAMPAQGGSGGGGGNGAIGNSGSGIGQDATKYGSGGGGGANSGVLPTGNNSATKGLGGKGSDGIVFLRYDAEVDEAMLIEWIKTVWQDTGANSSGVKEAKLTIANLALVLDAIDTIHSSTWTQDNLTTILNGLVL